MDNPLVRVGVLGVEKSGGTFNVVAGGDANPVSVLPVVLSDVSI